ncbi:jg21108 [Pararge aegeria aegeria]|uniref:Jg21108 protein n=4 Tax=Pararge aegeria TaxID=116150 RepID=A0A8S4RMH2_9NEOP|nr:jg21108 [Pararge aegeria aegeria]
MSKNVAIKLVNNADKAEKRLSELKSKLEQVKKYKVEEGIKELIQENEFLKKKVQEAKIELMKLETLNGKKQYPLPGKTVVTISNADVSKLEQPNVDVDQIPAVKTEKKEKGVAKKPKDKAAVPVTNDLIDVRKLDLRIGKIVDIDKHPDADTLYVEKIDCGEDNPRTVVSGLVNHVPIDEMKDRIVMVLCNLKPVKMRGVTSEAMVMCASSPDKVEVLIPPNGAIPGDLVTCEGYPREPEPQLNPKKKIFETCAPDLKTNDDCVACYKGSALVILGKGPVKAPTLKGVNVK